MANATPRAELLLRHAQRLELMVPAEPQDLRGLPLFAGIPEKARDKVIEKVRRFILADEPFSVENEMLTPSMKIRRHVIRKAYGERLDALYKK